MTASSDVTRSLEQYLAARNLPPNESWLSSFAATARLGTPLPALQKTAEYRLLATDITHSLNRSLAPGLPSTATDASIKDQALPRAIVVQVLDIEDIGRSRWSQIEQIEQHERGETTRGREIIRTVRDSEDRGPQQSEESRGPHKLLLQDVKGTKVYAFELQPIPGVGLGMGIGVKMLIRRASISRGLMLLEPSNVQILGGKVAAWVEQWQKDRKQMLKSKLNIPGENG
ncbi:hypothetical protein K461DRAFT_266523 [Myriangium duriaei CBS 260.36]|uniref:RecQ-mediated genome instability protein 1 n=1 Tax=Myriangium duriaei CBS 260.36 TaxID=1168546 RepID=A0A9P4J876_9PEZI|nr:hypothetical protein K461DRAFT_266523 [Myriangium duriaei CBS 260.36]